MDKFGEFFLNLSMTQLLSHTFAHLTEPSFRLKAKLLPNKIFDRSLVEAVQGIALSSRDDRLPFAKIL